MNLNQNKIKLTAIVFTDIIFLIIIPDTVTLYVDSPIPVVDIPLLSPDINIILSQNDKIILKYS